MSNPAFESVATWQYHDISLPQPRLVLEAPAETARPTPPPGLSEEECALRVRDALGRAKEQWEASAQEQSRLRDQKLTDALQEFAAQRTAYFRRVEAEVVHLALAVARKIVLREAAIDPTLLRGLVRVALDNISEQSNVRLRLPPENLPAWHRIAEAQPELSLECIPDPSLQPGEVILETQAGTAHLGFDAQLKQVEQGFVDLLAQRPESA